MLKKIVSNVLARAAEIHHKSSAEAAFDTWVETFCKGNPENVVALYAEDALLNATLNPIPMLTQQERLGYFRQLSEMPGMKVEVQSEYLRMFNDWLAVVSGLYQFSFLRNGELVKIPARYSMVFQRGKSDHWLVIDHHSSCLPDSILN